MLNSRGKCFMLEICEVTFLQLGQTIEEEPLNNFSRQDSQKLCCQNKNRLTFPVLS